MKDWQQECRKRAYEAVTRGADLLDKKLSDWHYAINLDELRTGRRDDCVFAQLRNEAFGKSGRAVLFKLNIEEDELTDYGLDSWGSIDPISHRDLAPAWDEAVLARLSAERS